MIRKLAVFGLWALLGLLWPNAVLLFAIGLGLFSDEYVSE